MKLRTLSLLSLAGMLLSSVSVYALTSPLVEAHAGVAATVQPPPDSAKGSQLAPSWLSDSSALRVEARVAHRELPAGGSTFVLVEARGADQTPRAHAASTIALAIDRSGSMAGERLAAALRAARGLVERLTDDDSVAVIAFDTRADVLVAPTRLGGDGRAAVEQGLSRISAGGDTCISCGVERAIETVSNSGNLAQLVVLSDGKATAGARTTAELGSVLGMAKSHATAITTVGVGVAYNETLLAALSSGSNGDHHFVENDSSLPALFSQVGQSLASTVASEARVELDLAPGVELVSVRDRVFQRSGRRVTIPIGALARGETKTVLAEVSVPPDLMGSHELVGLHVRFQDHVAGGAPDLAATLGAEVGARGSQRSDMDPLVAARLEQSRTSAVLENVNALYNRGEVAEAQRQIDEQEKRIETAASSATGAASGRGDARVDDIANNFRRQVAVTKRAKRDFKGGRTGGAPRPKPVSSCSPGDPLCADLDAAVRENQSDATQLRK